MFEPHPAPCLLLQAEVSQLHKSCEELQAKLEVTTQRLELVLSHSLGEAGGAGAAAAVYSGHSGAALARDNRASAGWLMGIFARSRTHKL